MIISILIEPNLSFEELKDYKVEYKGKEVGKLISYDPSGVGCIEITEEFKKELIKLKLIPEC